MCVLCTFDLLIGLLLWTPAVTDMECTHIFIQIVMGSRQLNTAPFSLPPPSDPHLDAEDTKIAPGWVKQLANYFYFVEIDCILCLTYSLMPAYHRRGSHNA